MTLLKDILSFAAISTFVAAICAGSTMADMLLTIWRVLV